VISIRTITRLHWVSQDLRDDLAETLIIVLGRRNRQQRALVVAAVFVAAGLACYLAAVTVAALVAGNFAPR
jgi:H+/gluconate symporter-like permease